MHLFGQPPRAHTELAGGEALRLHVLQGDVHHHLCLGQAKSGEQGICQEAGGHALTAAQGARQVLHDI